MKYKFILLFTILLIFGCKDAIDSPYPDIEFEQKTAIPTGGRSTAVAFVINEKAYVTLGRIDNYTATADCWEYDPITDSWSQKRNFPGKARVNAIAEVVNNKAYVGLGYNSASQVYEDTSILTDFWCYNPIDDSWHELTPFPSRTENGPSPVNSCFSFSIDNEIYVGANFNGYSFNTEFWKYNIGNNSWTQINKLPSRSTGAVSCSDGTKHFSGTGYQTFSDNSWWEYFPNSDTWTKRKSMPDDGRLNAVALSVNNRFFVATGLHFGGTLTTGHLFSDVMEYDVERNQWYNRGNIPNGERENAISFVIGNKAYIGLGENKDGIINDLWSFEP